MPVRDFFRALWPFGKKPEPSQRVYAAAAVNRLTGDWFTSLLSADQEIKGDLRRLRGASRALERDNPYGARYPQMIAENVVGSKGIQLQMRLKVTRGTPADRENTRIEEAFAMWGMDPATASADGRHSWVELQQMVARRLPVDGEVIIRHVRGIDNGFGYAIQLIDPDLLDVELGSGAPIKLASGNEIRLGVEVEPQFGRAVAYHLWTSHPADTSPSRKRVRIPADEIEHIYLALRPGQTRGVPWFAPVLISSNMRNAFEEAAITAARVGASSMAFIGFDAEKAGNALAPAPGASSIPMDVEPGRFIRGAPGEYMEKLPFDYPSQTFGPFVKNIDRSIANGLNVAYTSLTGDLEAVNYSSIRAGLLAERDFYRGLQEFLIAHLHRRVFREWARMASLQGIIAATDIPRLLMAAQWKPRGWMWVDPANDVEAASRAVQEGFTTRSAIAAERGEDFEDNVARLAEEQAIADAAGVHLGPTPPALNPNPDEDDDAGEGDDTAADVARDRHLALTRRGRLA